MNTEKLDFWIKNNYNVLMVGGHGIGKTSLVKEAFERNNLKWAYFSAATMDPWVDFIGVPKEDSDEQGNKFLTLVRPKIFQNDEIEAIFFDEFNRAPSKVRNAVMELIQFKSINGKKFNNLKIIWAAINPENKNDDGDSEYDVEKLDPAQRDRFHIIINMDDKPNMFYFKNKYGNDGYVAIKWWNTLPVEAKKNISPRRLDYVLDIYKKNGDISDAVPPNISTVQLLTQLKNGVYEDNIKLLIKENNLEQFKIKLKDINFLKAAKEFTVKNYKDVFKQIHTCFDRETISQWISTEKNISDTILNDSELINYYVDDLKNILQSNSRKNSKIIKTIREKLNTLSKKNKNSKMNNSTINSIVEGTNNILPVITKYMEVYRNSNCLILETTGERVLAVKDINNCLDNYPNLIDQPYFIELYRIAAYIASRTNNLPTSTLTHTISKFQEIYDKNRNEWNLNPEELLEKMVDKYRILKIIISKPKLKKFLLLN